MSETHKMSDETLREQFKRRLEDVSIDAATRDELRRIYEAAEENADEYEVESDDPQGEKEDAFEMTVENESGFATGDVRAVLDDLL